MNTLIAVIHIIVALILIVLVLIQDSKSSGALGIGGSSTSNSILGATGAQSLAAKVTVWAAVLFACTCLALTYYSSRGHKSVVDSLPLPSPVAPASSPETALPQDGAVPPNPNAPQPLKTNPAPTTPVPANPAAK